MRIGQMQIEFFLTSLGRQITIEKVKCVRVYREN